MIVPIHHRPPGERSPDKVPRQLKSLAWWILRQMVKDQTTSLRNLANSTQFLMIRNLGFSVSRWWTHYCFIHFIQILSCHSALESLFWGLSDFINQMPWSNRCLSYLSLNVKQNTKKMREDCLILQSQTPFCLPRWKLVSQIETRLPHDLILVKYKNRAWSNITRGRAFFRQQTSINWSDQRKQIYLSHSRSCTHDCAYTQCIHPACMTRQPWKDF